MTRVAFVASVTFGPDALHHQPWQTAVGFLGSSKACVCHLQPPRQMQAPSDAVAVFEQRDVPIVDDWPGTRLWAAANIDDSAVLGVQQYAEFLVDALDDSVLVVIDPAEPARLQAMIELGRFTALARNNVFAALHQKSAPTPWSPQTWCLRTAVLAIAGSGPDPTGAAFRQIVGHFGYDDLDSMTSTELVEMAVALYDRFGFNITRNG